MTVEQDRRTDAMWVPPAKGDADGWQALAKEYAILVRESDDGRCDSLQSLGQPCTRCKARHLAFQRPYADDPGANGYLDRMRLNARCIRTLQALQEQDGASRNVTIQDHEWTDGVFRPRHPRPKKGDDVVFRFCVAEDQLEAAAAAAEVNRRELLDYGCPRVFLQPVVLPATGSREAEAASHATTDSIPSPTPSSVVTTSCRSSVLVPPRSVAWWNALRLFTTAELAELGCSPWGEDIVRQGDRHLMLFPGSWHGRIPHGYVVWDISGDIREFDPDTHDAQTKGGALAFGLMASQDANATSERERLLARHVERLRKQLGRMREQLEKLECAVDAEHELSQLHASAVVGGERTRRRRKQGNSQ